MCYSIVLCKTCNKCLLANLAGSGCRSESSSYPERGLRPPLSNPAILDKVSKHHKLLCQSPQEPLPVGGIISAYRQKCSRASKRSKISGGFQPPIFSTQTQQQVEPYTIPEQFKPISQGSKIQTGDTGNHQNLLPARGVGYLNRHQGRVLTHSNTIQEISEISRPGSDIPIQGTPIRFVYSTHGVHCSSKGGETDGHTQGYKEWVTSIDFKDAYFHIPIQSRKYLRFHIQGRTYQYNALPFGLSTAPMEFTVVVKEVKLMAILKGIRIHQYLDDWLLRATSHQACFQHTQDLVEMCQKLG